MSKFKVGDRVKYTDVKYQPQLNKKSGIVDGIEEYDIRRYRIHFGDHGSWNVPEEDLELDQAYLTEMKLKKVLGIE